jgi:deoxycytidylate deaminase
MDIKRIQEILLDIARKRRNEIKYSIASAIIINGEIISIGINSMIRRDKKPIKFSPEFSLLEDFVFEEVVSIHAEVDAIIKATTKGINIRGATLVNAGVSKAGKIILTKPCRRCRSIIETLGIKEVFYTEKTT